MGVIIVKIKNPEMLELIIKSQKSIHKIKNTISQKKEIKELADKIKKIIDSMDKNIKDELDNLENYEKRLNEIKCEELEDNIDIIKKIIENNLPKDVKFDYNNEIMNLYIEKLKEKSTKYDRIDVGKVEINQDKEDSNQWTIKVTIERSEITKYNTNDFYVNDNIFRVYKVISYIHDNLSYDE